MKETKASIIDAAVNLLQLCQKFDAEVKATDPTKRRRPCLCDVLENMHSTGDLSDLLDRVISDAELRQSAAAKLSEAERQKLGLVELVWGPQTPDQEKA